MRARRTVRRALAGIVVGALALAVAGCQTGRADDAAADDGDDVTSGGDADGAGGEAPDGDPATLVLQVRTAGGFVPIGYDFASVPALSVYADGTAVLPGPMTLQYPPAALPNLQVAHLSQAALDELVAAAGDAGLLAPAPDYGRPSITDMPTTTVTIVVDGEAFVHAAYALGAGPGETPGEGGAYDDGALTAEQSAARVALAGFVQAANEAALAAGGQESYEISALAVSAMVVDPASLSEVEGVESATVPWPVPGVALADAEGGCVVVDGEDARALLAVLADANELTRYEQDGVVHLAWFRPLLPHERTCEDLSR